MRKLLAAAIALTAILTACSPQHGSTVVPTAIHANAVKPHALGDLLLSFDNATGKIYSWTISATGSSSPSVYMTPTVSTGASSMAGGVNTTYLSLAQTAPNNRECMLALSTGACTKSVPIGGSIDIAARNVGDEAVVSVRADGSVDFVPFDRLNPADIHVTCSDLSTGYAITSSRADETFVMGSGPGFSGTGIEEVTTADEGHLCSQVTGLKGILGTPGGLRVDPTPGIGAGTLYVVDNPASCASSGTNGRIIEYPYPWSSSTAIAHKPTGIVCGGLVRIDGDGSHLFIMDSNNGSPRIDQVTVGSWSAVSGYYTGISSPTAPTTIPNTTPD